MTVSASTMLRKTGQATSETKPSNCHRVRNSHLAESIRCTTTSVLGPFFDSQQRNAAVIIPMGQIFMFVSPVRCDLREQHSRVDARPRHCEQTYQPESLRVTWFNPFVSGSPPQRMLRQPRRKTTSMICACQISVWKKTSGSYAYLSKHVANESSFVCDGGTIECRMDIHVRRMANISDMNVKATGIAAMDRASGTRPVSI